MSHRSLSTPASRAGFTLPEVMISLVIGLIVLQVAVSFFAQQGRAYTRGTQAVLTAQNARYALNALEKDVRTLGTGVPAHQPQLVYGGPDVLSFNADYATGDAGDVFAVYLESGAPANQLQAATPGTRFLIPNTTVGYPDSAYRENGINSPAETITFFFQPDATTPRDDDYALYRQVNAGAAAVVARGLLRTGEQSFFEYLMLQVPPDAPTRLVSAGVAPLWHSAALHGSEQDTGPSLRADSVRAVRVRFTATSGETGPAERRRAVERVIRMPNAGQAVRRICGDEPQGAAVAAAVVAMPNDSRAVAVSWSPSVDETAGESDVLRYILWRRVAGAADWGDPFVSIPAGLTAYSYVDQSVLPGTAYQYALAAQDCTPSRSPLAVTGTVTP
jgi:prepilin-type N-terminal cleavage/methylation domain-containing protein